MLALKIDSAIPSSRLIRSSMGVGGQHVFQTMIPITVSKTQAINAGTAPAYIQQPAAMTATVAVAPEILLLVRYRKYILVLVGKVLRKRSLHCL